MTFTNQKALALYQTLQQLLNSKYDLSIITAYNMAFNLDQLEPTFKAIDAATKSNKIVNEFEQKRAELLKKYAKFDDNNQPVIQNNEFVLANPKEFNSEINALKKDYNDIDAIILAHNQELQKLLDKKITVDLHKIKLANLPQSLPGNFVQALYPILEE